MGYDESIVVKYVDGSHRDRNAVRTAIEYIYDENRERTKRLEYNIVGAIGTSNNNCYDIINNFILVKKIYKKNDGKQLEHFVVSFKNKPNVKNKKKFKRLIVRTASFWGRMTQVAYALHEDKDHLHIHLILNSIMYNGNRLDTYKIKHQFEKHCKKVWGKYI